MENQTDNTHIEDLAKGCLLGALCGDATGSYLEFRRSVTPEEADDALEMPGGGPFHLGSGQITDDGELALCLGQGLVDGQGVLELNKIARYYKKWVDSRPFDMGLTTRCALTAAAMAKDNFAKHARKGSQRSLESQSNGALMRITPMAIWCSLLRKDHLIKSVTEETKLTHPNQVAINASIAYVYTIQHLLNNKGDYQGAYEKCKEIAKEFEGKEIAAWIEEVEKDIMPTATYQIGWLKIAFCYSLKFLRKNESYINAMREMLLQGGDTDTNCCIVGGMLGALHGYKGLPKQMVETVMGYDGKSGVPRPEFLIPGKNVDTIIEEIIKIRPKYTYIVAGETDEERKSYKKGDD